MLFRSDLRRAHDDLGAIDARTLKMLARPGMGWCQGRICGYATAGIAACLGGRDATADDLRPLSGRTPAVPVRLGELAALAGTVTAEPAEPAEPAGRAGPAAPADTASPDGGEPQPSEETTERDGE